uniref:DUF4408 domain-containing protein n=1 Tax=Leersia perrieri TaxID=77586 RepID=A0A0D9VJ28_9ORYZ
MAPGTQAIHNVVVSANKQIISSALVPVAALLAVAVGALSLLPSLAQAVWEVPHLFLLGLVISYGVFAQNNSRRRGDGGGGDRAWNSRYLAGEPLVVVADNAESDDEGGGKPLSLPVRRLKPPAAAAAQAATESDGGGDGSDDGIGGAETDSSASTAGRFWGAGPSPPSVLDAVCRSRKFSAAATAAPSTMSKGYDSLAPRGDDQSFSDDGEVTDWDEEEEEEEEAGVEDEMAASPQRSYDDDWSGDGNGDRDVSADEELFERAAKAGAEVEDEVDRKADEFIAKFREQIRLQRL